MAGGRFIELAVHSGRGAGGIDFPAGDTKGSTSSNPMPDSDVTPKSDQDNYPYNYKNGLTRPIPSDVPHVGLHPYPIPLMLNKDHAKGYFRHPPKLKL
jgi:hypothetical protein